MGRAGGRARVALVGAGHAHLHVTRHAARLRAAGVDPVLIAPPWFRYSGLATAVLSGDLPEAEAGVDVAALAAACGVEHRPCRATGVDAARRQITLETGEVLTFDAVSLNIGSVARDPHGLSRRRRTWTVKPLSQLSQLAAALETNMADGRRVRTVVVAGGGQSGFEIAAAVNGLAARRGGRLHVFLVVRGRPAWGPPAALRCLERALSSRGVTMVHGEVIGRDADSCRLSDGQRLPCDHLVLAGGLEPAPLIGALGLPVAADGRLRVRPTLCSAADDAVFGVGDCAVVDQAPRPAAGVFGVRAAPVLLHNLAALGDGGPRRAFEPQRNWLSIMDLGDGRGLAMRGRFWSLGRPALRLKRYLDLGFVRRMRAPVPAKLESPHDGL